MVWTSINNKLRHLSKIFMSYISTELKLNKALELRTLALLLLIGLVLGLLI